MEITVFNIVSMKPLNIFKDGQQRLNQLNYFKAWPRDLSTFNRLTAGYFFNVHHSISTLEGVKPLNGAPRCFNIFKRQLDIFNETSGHFPAMFVCAVKTAPGLVKLQQKVSAYLVCMKHTLHHLFQRSGCVTCMCMCVCVFTHGNICLRERLLWP